LSGGTIRCEWRTTLPDPLPGPAITHFQADVGVRQLRAQDDWPRVLVALDEHGSAVATWVLSMAGSDPFNRPGLRLVRAIDRNLTGQYGPVIDPALPDAKRVAVKRALLHAVRRRVAVERPASAWFTLPPILDEGDRAEWSDVAHAAGYEGGDRHTWYVDLPETADEVAANARRDRRKAARKGESLGVVFTKHDDLDGLRAYADVRQETRLHNGHAPIPWEHWQRTWEAFAGSGVMHVFTASLDGRVGAGQLAFAWEGYVYLVGVSVAEWARAERVPANEFLQMGVLRWAVESGQRIVDFVGAVPDTDDPKLKAIDSFKASWGTQLGTTLTLTLPGSRNRARAAWAAGRLLA
jgi:hypothetical protein